MYLQFEEQRVTYEDLHHRITRAIAGLYELGIQKGDKVCIMLHNTPEYLDVWFALSFMGAITVPLNVHLKGDSLQYIVSHSDCKLIIVDKNFSSNNLLFVSYTKETFKLLLMEKMKA